MRPVKFPQANVTLMRPPSMTDEECSDLSVYRTVNQENLLSCWRPTWRERLAILFGRPVWLWVYGRHHPPVALEVQDPFEVSDALK